MSILVKIGIVLVEVFGCKDFLYKRFLVEKVDVIMNLFIYIYFSRKRMLKINIRNSYVFVLYIFEVFERYNCKIFYERYIFI